MTVSSSTNRVNYNGDDSTTVFAYSFKVFDQDDLTVILRSSNGTETVQTITTNYTVSGVGDAGGGNVTMVTAPATGEQLTILREQPLTQGLDLVPNDPFPANSIEESLDKITFMVQKHEEELGRAIKASRTNTISGAEFTVSASDRANKVFAFDSSGDLAVTQELGTFRGDWAASTAYSVRDLVKDTSTNNIFIVNSAHTSSGSQPLTTNANSAKYDLIVDAASATTSATNAASSAAAAATSATSASTAQTAAETAKTGAETAKTGAETAKTGAETAQAAAETAQAAAEAAADTFDDTYLGSKSSDPTVDNDGDALNAGDLYFNTTSNNLKVYSGSAWQDAALDASGFIATSGGTLTGNLNYGDSVKAQFGAGSDLQIYHDGSNSIIDETGTGDLQIKVGGTTKLSTSSTGVTVTGTAVATTDTDTTNSGSVTLDFGANQNFVLTLTGNVTLANPTTEQVGQSGFIVFIQDATGGRTVSLGTDYETAGGAGLTLSSAASTTDVVPYIVAASGRILLGTPQLAFA
jgi:hypothetical protein